MRVFNPVHSSDGSGIVDLELVATQQIYFKEHGVPSGYYNGYLTTPPILFGWTGRYAMSNSNRSGLNSSYRYPNGIGFAYIKSVRKLFNPVSTMVIVTNNRAGLDVEAEIQGSLEG